MKIVIILLALVTAFTLTRIKPESYPQADIQPHIIVSESDRETLRQINQVRLDNNLPALKLNSYLVLSASSKAQDMARLGYFSHTSPRGMGHADFINRSGIRSPRAGEILAEGYSAGRVVAAWVASDSHRNTILDPKFTQFGIGVSEGKLEGRDTVFYTVHFAQ